MNLLKRVPYTDVDGRQCDARLYSDGESYEARPFRDEHPIGRIVYTTTAENVQNARWGGFDALQNLIDLAKSMGEEISRIQASERAL